MSDKFQGLITINFTDADKSKVIKLLLGEHESHIDGKPNPAFEENHKLSIRLLAAMQDSDRLDYIEERALTSSTGTSFEYSNKQVRMAWRGKLGDRKAHIRQAIDWAMANYPVNPCDVPHDQQLVHDVPEPKARKMQVLKRKLKYHDPILDAVMRMVVEQASHDVHGDVAITPETDLLESGHLDSLDHIELLMEIEDTFSMEISEEQAEKVRTPLQIVEYLKRRGVSERDGQ